jgi:hypothetical protein
MSLSLFNCQRTYFLICSSFRPIVLTQYPRAQKCLPQYRFFNSGCLSNILMALLPFRNPTASETECFGGIHKTRCTWSICTFPSIISKSLHPHSSRSISLVDFPISPLKIRNRYFGHHIKWYLHSQIACANFLKLLIEYLLLIFRVTHLKLKEVFDFYNLTLNHYGTPISTAGTISIADGLW